MKQPEKQAAKGGRGVDGKAPGDARLNGIDYVEVDLRDAAGKPLPRPRLRLYFLGRAPKLTPANVVISGGRRITGLQVYGAIEVCRAEDPRKDDCVTIWLDRTGDASTYTLCLAEVEGGKRVPAPPDQPGPLRFKVLDGFNPRYACVDFTFTADCPTGLDCVSGEVCPPEERPQPEINYLAKDWQTFRQLILDRWAVTMPEWRERHIPDIGITLAELLAYAADSLSYYQDAVATEAYLDTARRRISVRRHVRLVDYAMHEGCNARAWVTVECEPGPFELDLGQTFFVTSLAGQGLETGLLPGREAVDGSGAPAYAIFEPVQRGKFMLRPAHNRIEFYTWGGLDVCLPRGATRATLDDIAAADGDAGQGKPGYGAPVQQAAPPVEQKGQPPDEPQAAERRLALAPGDVLIFEEVLGPRSGKPADADRGHRHAVRLTSVRPVIDPVNGRPVLEIEWGAEDALPFPLCLTSLVADNGCCEVEHISVARGNVVLVDHGGRVVPDEETGGLRVPEDEHPGYVCDERGRRRAVPGRRARFNPSLQRRPLTYAAALPADRQGELQPAAAWIVQDPREALPALRLVEKASGREWTARPDLLASLSGDPHFVVEIDDERVAWLRFGDGDAGALPQGGAQFVAAYRMGCGGAGNTGAETIVHIGFYDRRVNGVTLRPRNPLPATGGVEPEPVDEVRALAPHAFRHRLMRAITGEDYGALMNRRKGVQAARGALRWTGSWYEAHVGVDFLAAAGGEQADLLADLEAHLEPYRRIGHDLRVAAAAYAPLRLEMTICVADGYVRSDVRRELLDVFGSRVLPGGRRGLFHPDGLTFGQPVRLSALIAAAVGVEGVATATVDRISRLDLPGDGGDALARERGFLPVGPFEIVRLDNDALRPENGSLKLTLKGGR